LRGRGGHRSDQHRIVEQDAQVGEGRLPFGVGSRVADFHGADAGVFGDAMKNAGQIGFNAGFAQRG
jgi:hypothetical protein